MARPRKEEGTRRTEIVHIRLTTNEAALLAQQADAAGMTISDYIRSLVTEGSGSTLARAGRQRRLPPDVGEAVRMLSSLGVNLMALRRAANEGAEIIDPQVVTDAAAMIVNVLKRLDN
jgi:uncharacterized protein (DUF1778 family)